MLNSEFQFIYFCFITLPIDFFVGCRNSSIEISSITLMVWTSPVFVYFRCFFVVYSEKMHNCKLRMFWPEKKPADSLPFRRHRGECSEMPMLGSTFGKLAIWNWDRKSFRKLEYGENKTKDYSILTDVIPLEFLVLGIVNTRSPSSILAVINWGSESIGIWMLFLNSPFCLSEIR